MEQVTAEQARELTAKGKLNLLVKQKEREEAELNYVFTEIPKYAALGSSILILGNVLYDENVKALTALGYQVTTDSCDITTTIKW